MKKRIVAFKSMGLLLMALLCLTLNLNGQSLSSKVIASTGNFSSATGIMLSSTIGELMIATDSQSNVIMTQGFQQPEIIILGVEENELGLTLISYPNPVIDELTIELASITGIDLKIKVTDMLGRQMMIPYLNKISSYLQKITLDMNQLSPGLYLIRLMSEDEQLIKAIKINKL